MLLFLAVWGVVCSPAPGLAASARGSVAAPAPLSAVPPATVPFSTVHDVLALSPAQAASKRQVRLEAVVTYYQPNERVLFVQDATGAIYIATVRNFNLHKGDKVIIAGHTASSYRNTVWSRDIRVVGEAPLPVPKQAHFGSLINGEIDCDYVEVRGRVRSATIQNRNGTPFLLLEILADGGPMTVHVLNFGGADPYDLLDSSISFPAAAAKTFDDKFEPVGVNLYVQDFSDIDVLSRAKIKPLDLPISPFNRVAETYRANDLGTRIRVRGTVTFSVPGEMLVLEEGGKTLVVHTRQNDSVAIGEVVDAVGFSDFADYGPSLDYAQFIPTGRTASVPTQPTTYEQAVTGLYSYNVVSLPGVLVGQVHEMRQDMLVIKSGAHIVSAIMRSSANGLALPVLKVGSHLRVTGVCFIDAWDAYHSPTDLTIQLRSPDDVAVLAQPSWMTVGRLALIVGLLLAVVVVVVMWGVMLKRRVAQQTEIIRLAGEEEAARERRSILLEKERSRVLEAINSSQPLDSVLALIAAFIENQIWGVVCFFRLVAEVDPQSGISPDSTGRVFSAPSEAPASESSRTRRAIQSSEGCSIAELTLISKDDWHSSPHIEEVVEIGSRLAALAIENRQLHARLVHRSEYDQLTDVPNRFMLEQRLQQAIAEARSTGGRLGVVYIDLNDFKLVNDRYGHRVGDIYLQQAAQRLAAQLRTQDLLARIGGDEFLAIIHSVSGREEVNGVVERLLDCFSGPFTVEDIRLSGSASIGVAMYPEDGEQGEDLKRVADHDMYAQKRRSKQSAMSTAS